MDGRNYFHEIKKHCTSEKNSSLRLDTVTHKEKWFFRNNYFGSQPFLMGCYLTKVFVQLPAIPVACYFNVYKLTGWDPANVYLSKVNRINARKKAWNMYKINNKDSRKSF